MGLLGRLRGLFGGEEPAYESDSEDLLELPGLAMTVERRVGLVPSGDAALCFAPADGDEFAAAIDDLQGVLDAAEAETGTRARFRDDGHGYRWLVLAGDGLEDLATGLQFAAETFVEARHGDQLLAGVLAFDAGDAAATDADRAYVIYSFERGRFYPFVPEGGEERDTATEFRLQSVLADEVPFEDDRTQWFPLWPERPGRHPWE